MRSRRREAAPLASAGHVRVTGWMTLALALFSLLFSVTRDARASGMAVPPGTQAELLAKLAGFDRNFAARAGSKAVILLVAMPGNSESTRAALEMKAALGRQERVGDLPHEEHIVTHSSTEALVETVRARRAAIVYFGPGFEKQIPALSSAFASVNVLTVGANPAYVPAGVVLGFDLVSGRPKLLVHVLQARKQQVSFPASVLNLMKVYP
jgi:hypothetical protein